MAETTAIETGEKKKFPKSLALLSLVLALAGAGGGFFVAYQGLVPGDKKPTPEMAEKNTSSTQLPEDLGFVALDPLVISLGQNSGLNLRFRAQLEIREKNRQEVEKILPRIIDVLNSYLRALDIQDIEEVSSLVKLRSQMLRRIQVVAGVERVQDLLIMEFVVN